MRVIIIISHLNQRNERRIKQIQIASRSKERNHSSLDSICEKLPFRTKYKKKRNFF